MADLEEDRKPWTIKGFPGEEREIATRCAIQEGQTLGVWLAVAIRNQADRQANMKIIAPVGHVADLAGMALTQNGLPERESRQTDLSDISVLVTMAQQLENAPNYVRAHVHQMLDHAFRQARGLPERRSGKTPPRIGATPQSGQETDA